MSSSDVTPPRVREIRFAYAPAQGDTYELGETTEVGVEFDRAVEATGKPQVALIGTCTVMSKIRDIDIEGFSF